MRLHPLAAAALLLIGLDALAGLAVRAGRVGEPFVDAQERWRALERSEGRARWLLVGDSACGAAISADALSARLNAPVLKLCSVGDFTLVNSAWMVERYVERWGPPAGVIVAEAPRAWAIETPRELVATAVTLDWDALGRLDPPIRPLSSEGLAVLAWRWAPLYASGEDIGFSLLGRPPLEPLRPAPARSVGRVSDENRVGLRALAALSRKAHFELAVVSMPVNAVHFDEAIERSYRASVAAELGKAGLGLVKGVPPSWPAEEMRDRYHMLPSGRARFSELLADALTPAPRRAIH